MMSQTAGGGCAGCSKKNCGEVAQRHAGGDLLRWIGGGTQVSNDHGVRALELAGRCQRIVVNVKSRDDKSP